MQKNRTLLKHIIKMSSDVDSMVMDCLCGSGGFLQESFLLGRKFIGIDYSFEAVQINTQWIKNHKTNLYPCECNFLESVSNRIINEVDVINRVVYDIKAIRNN